MNIHSNPSILYNCFKQSITLSFISTGHSISRRLESDSGFQRQQGDVGYATQDQLVMNREVDDRLSAIQQKQNQLKEYLAERDRKLGSHMQRGELESGIKRVRILLNHCFQLSCIVFTIFLCVSTAPMYQPCSVFTLKKISWIPGNFWEIK